MTKEELFVQRPIGTKDYLPQDAALLRFIENKIRNTFGLWGYQEVITPTFEYFDLLRQGSGPESDEMIFRFFDREGHILGLRSDATTPIARLAATRFHQSTGIQRFSYLTNIFRYIETGMGREREFHQAGIELIGSADAKADAEVISLAAQVFSELNVQTYRFDLGVVGFSLGVLEEAGLSPREQKQIWHGLLEKDFVLITEVLAQSHLTQQRRKQIEALTQLRGGVEVLDRGREFTESAQALAALDRLEQVYRSLPEGVRNRVTLDLGMLKDLEYYTGVIFEGYVSDLGYTVCTGGRYDRLIERFGVAKPATGFGIGLERLQELVSLPQNRQITITLSYADSCNQEAFELAELLRKEGYAVVGQLDAQDGVGSAGVEITAKGRYLLYTPGQEAVCEAPAQVLKKISSLFRG